MTNHQYACEVSDKHFKSRTIDSASNRCCDVLFEHDDGRIAYHLNNGCHGFMSSPYPSSGQVNSGNLKTITTSLWCTEVMKPMAEAYWSFITGKDSPWKDVVNDATVIRRDNGDMCGVRVRADLPAQLLVNFFIATRQPYEHSAHVVSFNEYLKEGFTPAQSMYLSNFAILRPNGGDASKATSTAHYPLNQNISWKKFSEAKPDITGSKSYKDSKNYLPCNSIWDKGDKKPPSANYIAPTYNGQNKIYEYLGKTAGYSGSFEKLHKAIVKENNKLPKREVMLANVNKYSKEIFCGA